MVEAGKILRVFCRPDKQKKCFDCVNIVGSVAKVIGCSLFF
jgi:hypothetical protein